MKLNFREWLLNEMSVAQAAQLLGYQPGDVIGDDLKKRYRKLTMQYHPDRNPGDTQAEAMMKQIAEAYPILSRLIGQKVPGQFTGQHYQTWQPKVDPLADIRDELNRAIMAIKKGQPEDAFAAVSRLVDPYTGKLNSSTTKPILKTSLQQWLGYYKQGFHDYLEPILANALKLV